MSLPPGFLDELRSRVSLAQVVGRKVSFDARKSNQGKGDFWAPCPFHQEKTASFHVLDREGYYYCFGCHAKGDAISFLRETENLGFMEAVEALAREAGMEMPARDPAAAARAEARGGLAEIMEQAVQFYRLQLATAAAAGARDYLAGRGLGADALDRWEIGFAPGARRALWGHLTGKGIAGEKIVEAGLAAEPEGGGAPYDRFRGRILFPIRDARGRAIALGGRAMDPGARAKYLNSPQTPLFDKGRTLFNHGPARTAAGKGQPLVVAEGYMDVIALASAGFEAAVAPLGTAITAEQLQLLWRMSDEPVIALDGDTAGLRAAMRLVDLALPLMEAGRSLRFALMPAGQDPDDVLRAGGPRAMARLLDAAVPMVSLLWRRETEGRSFDSPERRAALDKSLRAAIGRIRDSSIRSHYGAEIARLRAELFGRPAGGARGRRAGGRAALQPAVPMPETRGSLLAAGGAAAEEALRVGVILALLVRYPDQLDAFEDPLAELELADPDHRAARAALVRALPLPPEDRAAAIAADAGAEVLENLLAPRHVRIVPALRAAAPAEVVAQCLSEEFGKLAARRGAEADIGEAKEEIRGLADEDLTWRLKAAAEARQRASRSRTGAGNEFETGPNGARVSREEKTSFEALLENIGYRPAGPGDGEAT